MFRTIEQEASVTYKTSELWVNICESFTHMASVANSAARAVNERDNARDALEEAGIRFDNLKDELYYLSGLIDKLESYFEE